MTNKTLAVVLGTLLAVLPGAAVIAQSAAAKAGGMAVQSGEPKATKTAAASPKKAPTKVSEDARHCLELGNTTEIVKCAEPYRY